MSGLDIRVERKAFPAVGAAPPRLVLEGFGLAVPESQFLALVGPSGCGKTTLLNLIAGLDRDWRGTLRLPARADGAGEPVLGYMFQNPRLFPWRTVAENLALVLPDSPDRRAVIERWLDAVGLAGHGEVYPGRLSLGMARRAALARAFAVEPTLLLMDEPFVSVDQATALRLRELLVRIWGERPTTVVLVTHDLREAIALADRIVLLDGPPMRIVGDVPVTLPRGRRDDAAVERLRAVLATIGGGVGREAAQSRPGAAPIL